MNDSVEYWEQYKKHVEQSMGDFGKHTPVVLSFGLASEICEVFDITKQEIINGDNKRLDIERASELGDVLWFIAAIEILYKLPHPRYVNYIGMALEMNNVHMVNLLETQAESLANAADISTHMIEAEADDIQYALNKLFGNMLDLCMVYGINILDCLQASVNKVTKRHPEGFDKDAVKDYDKEYKAQFKATRHQMKKQGAEEIIFELKLDHRSNNPYKSIKLRILNKTHLFDSGDIIVDFFNASNFVAKNYKGREYYINYSPKFRQLLDKTVDTLVTGYIVNGDELITGAEVKTHLDSSTNTVYMSKSEARPILMTPNMTKLNHLLDYVNKSKNNK